MNPSIVRVLPVIFALTTAACDKEAGTDEPPAPAVQYTADGKLKRPPDYREWVFLSSGIGMTYTATPEEKDPPFGNVFVPPEAYRSFLTTGTWPDKTIFVVEVRASTSRGSINQGGHYQTNLLALEAEVKDSTRFSNTWAYFSFTSPSGSLLNDSEELPKKNCFDCHAEHAAVEHSFVQFYPTLFEVAKSKGTLRPDYPK